MKDHVAAGTDGRFLLEARGLTKSFNGHMVNDHVSLQLKKGKVLAILGENGSGKTTLINMLSGLYQPDHGEILIDGKAVEIHCPGDALKCGIGVVHQHPLLVDSMTAAENITMGIRNRLNGGQMYTVLENMEHEYGFKIPLTKKAGDMAVAEKQITEILKALYRHAQILILDEPTAVLTPVEIQRLFSVIRQMKKQGASVLIITHKLDEVKEISDSVLIIRKGKAVGCHDTATIDARQMASMMVGEQVSMKIEYKPAERRAPAVSVKELTCFGKHREKILQMISFDIYRGEILGIAGMAGSGQRELCDVLAGISDDYDGMILPYKKDIKIGYVPEDRLGMGLMGSGDVADNMILRDLRLPLRFRDVKKLAAEQAEKTIKNLDVHPADPHIPVRLFSGGNIQKVLLGREMMNTPDLLLLAYPVRGLDIGTSEKIYQLMNEAKEEGCAVVFVGESLDALMQISDRLIILADHGIGGILRHEELSREEIGMLMMGGRM